MVEKLSLSTISSSIALPSPRENFPLSSCREYPLLSTALKDLRSKESLPSLKMIFSASISIPESIRSAKSMHSSPSTLLILKGLLRVNRKLCRATFWAEIVILPGLFSAFGPFLRFRIRSRLVVLISSFCRLNVPPLIVTLSKTSLLSKSSQIFRVASARFT